MALKLIVIMNKYPEKQKQTFNNAKLVCLKVVNIILVGPRIFIRYL